MPEARSGAGGGVVAGSLYVVGGVAGSDYGTTTVVAYDPASNAWFSETPMPTGRVGIVTGIHDDEMYVVGGSNQQATVFSVNEAYAP